MIIRAAYQVRYFIDDDEAGVRRVYQRVLLARDATNAVTRATRDHAALLFGTHRRGKVLSCTLQ